MYIQKIENPHLLFLCNTVETANGYDVYFGGFKFEVSTITHFNHKIDLSKYIHYIQGKIISAVLQMNRWEDKNNKPKTAAEKLSHLENLIVGLKSNPMLVSDILREWTNGLRDTFEPYWLYSDGTTSDKLDMDKANLLGGDNCKMVRYSAIIVKLTAHILTAFVK